MSINIYYLDDEPALCEIFSELVSSDEIKVTTFIDPEDAIESCKKTPPNVFFIDYRLPGTTGDKVASALNESIPKVLVTGDISTNTEYDFIQVIPKPCDFKLIQKLIKSYL